MPQISFREDILPLKDKLFRLAWRITLDRTEAEDVVQESLIRVWNKKEEWSEIESIEAYCLTITRNLAIDRSQKMDAQHAALTDEMEHAHSESSPQTGIEQREQLGIIHKLINDLPEKQRTVMQLRDIEGSTYKEIADALQITEEQVKVTLFRARQKVKQKYTQIDEYGL